MLRFYPGGRLAPDFDYNFAMRLPVRRELMWIVCVLALGFGLLPLLIFGAGSATLGRYEGASVANLYASVYHGLETGSVAAWLVVLGPLVLYALFRAIRFWWRATARWA